MRQALIILSLALVCLTFCHAAVYRRGDKISEHFKQLDLPPEEIDPNVDPNNDPDKINIAENEIIDDLEDQANAVAEMEEAEALAQAQALATESTIAPAANSESVTSVAPAESTTPIKGEVDEPSGLAKYCKCTGSHCDCCRNFNLPFVPVKGPGCARMTYLGNEKMSVSLKYGDLTLITRTVSSKRARPICVGLPGGYSQFCGRVYGLSKAKENFKACLGFELRADDEVEAALRVSCFKFGPEGLRVADAEPLPSETVKEEDDDDDIFGFAAGGDDEDDDDYDDENENDEEEEEETDDEDTDYADDDDNEEAPADADYGGFSLAGLLDELDDDDDDESKPSTTPVTAAVAPVAAVEAAAASPAAAAPIEATRTADTLQSKDEKGSAVTTAVAVATDEAAEPVAETSALAAADNVTPATESTATNTTSKGKKSKKSKKNKKKKAVDTESDFAIEILNGLLDFFN